MIGAIIGDIAGSKYEFENYRYKDFDILDESGFFTDDSVMTIAVAKAIADCEGDYSALSEKTVECMQTIGRPYRNCGYGGRFYGWMYSDNPAPYNSFGNGAAMRVSACGEVAKTLSEALWLAEVTTAVTHNHPEGIKGAKATAAAIFLARLKKSKAEIRAYIEENFYKLDFTIDEIRPTYKFNETCQETVPQAIEAFLESESFDDAIQTAVSVGGDSDTLAAITGSIAQAFYGVCEDMKTKALEFLDARLLGIYNEVSQKLGII